MTIETKWFPPLTVDLSPTPADAPPGIADLVSRALKPRVTIALHGQTVTRVAPYGEPVPNQWGTVKIVLAVAAGLAVFSVLRILR